MSAPVQPGLNGHVELPWHRGPLASFDTETSGVNIGEDRIVSAALITPSGARITWLSDADGVEIPEAASNLHGITTEHARRYGRPAKEVVEDIAATLTVAFTEARAALVVMNAPFDLSLLDAECARHGVPERDSEKKRADRLQKQYDDAAGLSALRGDVGLNDSEHWKPPYSLDAKRGAS